VYARTHRHTCIHTLNLCMHARTRSHSRIHTRTQHACTHACIYTCINTRIHACTRAHTQLPTHTRTQGEMCAWDPKTSEWLTGHAVLTRSGFLHWIRSVGVDKDSVPEQRDIFCLARCVCLEVGGSGVTESVCVRCVCVCVRMTWLGAQR